MLLTLGLVSLDASFISHVKTSGLNLYSVNLYKGYVHVAYGQNDLEASTEYIYFEENYSSMCASSTDYNSSSNYKTAKALLKKHTERIYKNGKDYSFHVEPSNMSCTIVDFNLHTIWLVSDIIGSIPLWYGLSTTNKNFMITSDLFGAQQLGYITSMTALGPGQIIAIDMKTYEIRKFSHWKSNRQIIPPVVPLYNTLLSVYTNTIFNILKGILQSYITKNILSAYSIGSFTTCNKCEHNNDRNNHNIILLDHSPIDSGSQLLVYAFSAMNINRVIKTSEPLVLDGHQPTDEIYLSLVGTKKIDISLFDFF